MNLILVATFVFYLQILYEMKFWLKIWSSIVDMYMYLYVFSELFETT